MSEDHIHAKYEKWLKDNDRQPTEIGWEYFRAGWHYGWPKGYDQGFRDASE